MRCCMRLVLPLDFSFIGAVGSEETADLPPQQQQQQQLQQQLQQQMEELQRERQLKSEMQIELRQLKDRDKSRQAEVRSCCCFMHAYACMHVNRQKRMHAFLFVYMQHSRDRLKAKGEEKQNLFGLMLGCICRLRSCGAAAAGCA